MNYIIHIPKALLFLKHKGPKGLLLLFLSKAWRNIGEAYFWNHNSFASITISLLSSSIKVINYLFARQTNRFVFAPYSNNLIRSFADSLPESYSSILSICDDLNSNQLNFKPIGRIDISTSSVWTTDLLTNKIYPKTPKQNFHKQLTPEQGDPRLLWELNRLQFLVTLAQGYVLTKNDNYLKAANRIITSWTSENKYCLGINWADSQEVGIRMTSLLISHMLFESAGASLKTNKEINKLILEHSDYVLFNLSLGRATHNHLLTELASLLIYSLINTIDDPLINLKKELASRLLKIEIEKQLDTDGISREQSTNYTLFVYDAIILANYFYYKSYGNNLVKQNTLKNIVNAINCFSVGDKDFVKIGDADCGRHSRLSWNSDLSRLGYTKVIDKIFLNIDDNNHQPSEELFWLSPSLFPEHYNTLNEQTSLRTPHLFRDSGFMAYSYDNKKLFLRLGPTNIDPDVRFGHSHSDYLSFSLYLNETAVFIDPGTITYLGPDSKRAELRSANYHNTATLDGTEFLDINTYRFGIPELLPVNISDLKEHDNHYSLESSFQYKDMSIVRRIFVFDKDLDTISIINHAQSTSYNALTESYALTNKVKQLNTNGCQFDLPDNNCGNLHFLADNLGSSSVSEQIIEYAPRYAESVNGTLLKRNTPLSNGSATTYTIIRLTNNGSQPNVILQTALDLVGNDFT